MVMFSVFAFLRVLVITTKLIFVACFPFGPPWRACFHLTPHAVGHEAPPQTIPVPYDVDFSDFLNEDGTLSYEQNRNYTLSIASNDTEDPLPFRGFLLIGRSAVDEITHGGTFIITDPQSRISICQPRAEAGINHRNADDKMNISMQWTPPPPGFGPVNFGFVMVRNKTIYWSNMRTETISEVPVTTTPKITYPETTGSNPNPQTKSHVTTTLQESTVTPTPSTMTSSTRPLSSYTTRPSSTTRPPSTTKQGVKQESNSTQSFVTVFDHFGLVNLSSAHIKGEKSFITCITMLFLLAIMYL